MIYLSSTCVKYKCIGSAVNLLAENGLLNIELSGGFGFSPNQEEELIALKKKFNLSYLCHNSFACSGREDLVVNLASLNDKIYLDSLNYLKKAIRVAKKIGANKFGVHAGFFIDLKINDLGRAVSLRPAVDKKKAFLRFCDGFNILKSVCGSELGLYIENNVYSLENRRVYGNNIPFMLTHYADYKELRKFLDFKLLLDIAHLKVSSNSLGINFDNQLKKLICLTDYIHLSETEKTKDQNKYVSLNSPMRKCLRNYNLTSKTITLEIRGGIPRAKSSFLAVKSFLSE